MYKCESCNIDFKTVHELRDHLESKLLSPELINELIHEQTTPRPVSLKEAVKIAKQVVVEADQARDEANRNDPDQWVDPVETVEVFWQDIVFNTKGHVDVWYDYHTGTWMSSFSYKNRISMISSINKDGEGQDGVMESLLELRRKYEN